MKKVLLGLVVIAALGVFSSCDKVEDGKCKCTAKVLGVKSTEIYDKEEYGITDCSELGSMDLGIGSFKCK